MELTIYTPLKQPTVSTTIAAIDTLRKARDNVVRRLMGFASIELVVYLDGYDDPSLPKFCDQTQSVNVMASKLTEDLTSQLTK